MVDAALAEFGRIDILVNDAGIVSQVAFADLEVSEWDRVMSVNLRGVFLCTRFVLPGMLERRRGKIINVASQLGQIGGIEMVHYSASKAGVIGLTKALAREVSARGIQVNAIAPGPILTEMMARGDRGVGGAKARRAPDGAFRPGARGRPDRGFPRLRRLLVLRRPDALPQRRRRHALIESRPDQKKEDAMSRGKHVRPDWPGGAHHGRRLGNRRRDGPGLRPGRRQRGAGLVSAGRTRRGPGAGGDHQRGRALPRRRRGRAQHGRRQRDNRAGRGGVRRHRHRGGQRGHRAQGGSGPAGRRGLDHRPGRGS